MEERAKRTMAKVVAREGHYYVQQGQQLQEIDPVMGGGEEVLKRLDGMEVEVVVQQLEWPVALINSKIRVVCYVPPPDLRKALFGDHFTQPVETPVAETRSLMSSKTLHPTCYLPRDWLIRGVEEQVRINLLKQLVEENIITPAINERLSR